MSEPFFSSQFCIRYTSFFSQPIARPSCTLLIYVLLSVYALNVHNQYNSNHSTYTFNLPCALIMMWVTTLINLVYFVSLIISPCFIIGPLVQLCIPTVQVCKTLQRLRLKPEFQERVRQSINMGRSSVRCRSLYLSIGTEKKLNY